MRYRHTEKGFSTAKGPLHPPPKCVNFDQETADNKCMHGARRAEVTAHQIATAPLAVSLLVYLDFRKQRARIGQPGRK